MKTVIFNGSPRKSGDTATLINEFRSELKGKITVFSAYAGGISPCTDCRYCHEHSGCSIADGMDGVYNSISDCDNLVIASPLHFSELSGPLLSLFGRFQTYYAAKYIRKKPEKIKRKNGVLILAGGGSGGSESAVRTAETVFQMLNTECVSVVTSLKTDVLPASLDEAALSDARNAGKLLSSLSRS
ncbi:MAG: flavodoxin family protein [Ruminococcaceae bacterium]|nr:flavodoxin family protein [Oscillospiraceae bacterium]